MTWLAKFALASALATEYDNDNGCGCTCIQNGHSAEGREASQMEQLRHELNDEVHTH